MVFFYAIKFKKNEMSLKKMTFINGILIFF